MYKSMVSALTAQNATETTKTLVDTLTVPQGVKALIGVGAQINGAGTTTLEGLGSILELESDDMSPWGGTQQFLVNGMVNGNGAGWAALNPYIHPTNIPVTPGAHIKCSMTFDLAQTINPSSRVQLVFE